jgi:glycosyltransferase involved in cell wall biosynthesis
MLSLGVIVPVRNSMKYLPAHLRQMNGWADLAQEIVVVDSQSTDGSVQCIREQLRHPRLTFLEHPPGLYASWNFGISRLATEYTYIATTGDTVTRDGLQSLVEAAERLKSDVVVSPPEFIAAPGASVPRVRWPVEELIEALAIKEPRVIDSWDLFAYGIMYAIGRGLNGVLGSSASNIYRTRTLQAFPFPEDCGSVGDTFWGLLNAFHVRFAISPIRCSTFLLHPKESEMTVETFNQLTERAITLSSQVLEEQNRAPASNGKGARLGKLLQELRLYRQCYSRLEGYRRSQIPWIINPRAWQTRRRRNVHRNNLRTITRDIYNNESLQLC